MHSAFITESCRSPEVPIGLRAAILRREWSAKRRECSIGCAHILDRQARDFSLPSLSHLKRRPRAAAQYRSFKGIADLLTKAWRT